MPYPESIVICKASENVFKENWSKIQGRTFFGDKIYNNHDLFDNLYTKNQITMLTPIKGIKGKSEVLKQRYFAYENLYSKAVSAIRQPIESLFNWIDEKTQIQNASKVRSFKGLMVHIFEKHTACFLKPIINP